MGFRTVTKEPWIRLGLWSFTDTHYYQQLLTITTNIINR